MSVPVASNTRCLPQLSMPSFLYEETAVTQSPVGGAQQVLGTWRINLSHIQSAQSSLLGNSGYVQATVASFSFTLDSEEFEGQSHA